MGRKYEKGTAIAIFNLAYEGWGDPVPYIVRDDGIYQSESFVDVCPPEKVFDWTPAYDMDWPDRPDATTAPMLPVPFTACQLAACMLDGAGYMIQEAIGWQLGYPIKEDDVIDLGSKRSLAAEALRAAYLKAADAQTRVGAFDYQLEIEAHRLRKRHVDANNAANMREGVFERGIGEEEYRRRRERATKSVAELKNHADEMSAESDLRWRTWRKAMVRALLADQESAPEHLVTRQVDVVHRIGGRQDAFAPVLDEAIRRCHSENPSTAEVWGMLQHMSAEKYPPLDGAAEGDIKYRDGGVVKLLSRKALAGRMRRRREKVR